MALYKFVSSNKFDCYTLSMIEIDEIYTSSVRTRSLPRAIAPTLLYNHLHTDWRDQIVRIRQPTLIVSGRKSIIPWQSQVWLNQSIPNSELEIFEAAVSGRHFTFIENPGKFNRRVLQFLTRSLKANQER